MFWNYLKVALRNLTRRSFHSIINVLGLAIGIASCLLILAYVSDELSFDRFHQGADRIYRVENDVRFAGKEDNFPVAPAPLAMAAKAELPQVEEAVRLRVMGGDIITFNDQSTVKAESVVFADSNFFQFFTFSLLKGDPEKLLTRPQTVALSQTLAEKIFGDDDPIGKTITIDDQYDYEVTGVYANMPENSHFKFDAIYSMGSLEESKQNVWVSNNFFTYFKLREGVDVAGFEETINDWYAEKIAPQLKEFMGVTVQEFEEAGNYWHVYLRSITDIHLYSQTEIEMRPAGDIRYVYIFAAIALFMLLIAAVNFMNLATAKSEHRAREVGVRKVLGAERKQLIFQFLTEATLISTIAMLLALVIVELALPSFNAYTDKSITVGQLFSGWQFWVIICLPFVVGLLSGSYPAFFLSSFRPVAIIRGKLNVPSYTKLLRNGLVVFQFVIAIFMIVGTVVIYQQLRLLQTKDLGYNKDNLLVIENFYLVGEDRTQTFEDEVAQISGVKHAVAGSYFPTSGSFNKSSYFPDGNPSSELGRPINIWFSRPGFLETMDINLKQGRDFEDYDRDSLSIIVNEEFVRVMQLKDPIGKQFGRYGGDINGDPEIIKFTIIGVVENFNFADIKLNIEPLVIELNPKTNGYLIARVEQSETESVIAAIRDKWETFTNNKPFDYSFVDQRLYDTFTAEQKLGQLFGVFCLLAIFIACLGLFGLASFTAEQRTREIGIRKVLGAGVPDVLSLLLRDFSKLIVISFVLGAPLAYYVMSRWLDGFAYSVTISWVTFLVAALLITVIALATVSYQSIRAARLDPVFAIKRE